MPPKKLEIKVKLSITYSVDQIISDKLPGRHCGFGYNKVNFFLINLFIYLFLFLAVLGLCCCAQAFSTSGERGLLFVAVRRLLTVVASLVAEHGL